jgi:hypothetical protein
MLHPGQPAGQVLVRLVQVRDLPRLRGDLPILRGDPLTLHRDLLGLHRDPLGLHRDLLGLLADQHDQLIAGHLLRGRHRTITAAPEPPASPTRRATSVTAATSVTHCYPGDPDHHSLSLG